MADGEFRCPVCLEVMTNPRMLLPCTHTLCEAPCLEQLLQGSRTGSTVGCPICRTKIKVPTEGAKGFPRNIYIGNEALAGKVSLIESVKVGQSTRDKFKVGDVSVYIYQASITQIPNIDAILSPTNSDLDLGGGVARVIAVAAGDALRTDCKAYLRQYGRVGVGEVVVSSAGDLSYKGVVHAVGPEWDGYSNDVKTVCAQDLYTTVTRALSAVAEKGWKSVGVCAIGSGQGGIPKQLCAEMHMKAIIDSRHTAARNLEEIHFVDIDDDILSHVTKAHREWMTNNDVLDFKNALRYTTSS